MYENETYEGILERILERMPSNVDTRESSFLYNASAPIAVELQNIYIAIDNILNITFFDSADREGKLQRCRERGIDLTQFEATNSVVVMEVTPAAVDVPIGSKFNLNDINFSITSKIENGKYYATCDISGLEGNVTGEVTPVNYISGLESAIITEIYQYGENEADESLIDEIYYASIDSQAFGGNRADYIEKMKKIAGVGGVKVYSAAEWHGGGTVKLVFTTSAHTKPTQGFIDAVQTQIDPIQNQGAGYGIAPIGHIVSVFGVDETPADIAFTLTLQSGYTWQDVEEYVNAAIDKYFEHLNSEWEHESNIVVRISQLETRILEVSGVIDIDDMTINGADSNLTVDKDSIVIRGAVNASIA